jgi:hypothetical protein
MRGESSAGFIITMLFLTRFLLTCSRSRIPRVSALASSFRNTRDFSSRSAVLLSQTTRAVGGGGAGRHHHHRHLSSASSFLGLMMAVTSGSSFVYCQKEDEDDDDNGSTIQVPPFHESVLTYDHYNGVTMHLDKLGDEEVTTFPQSLKKALTFWKAEGRKGIWINAPPNKAHLVPVRLLRLLLTRSL